MLLFREDSDVERAGNQWCLLVKKVEGTGKFVQLLINMKYQALLKACMSGVLAVVLLPAFSAAAAPSPGMAPLPPDLQALVPCLASRRLSVNDFLTSREQWAQFYHYRKLEARVRQTQRDGAWVRVDFDQAREGRDMGGEIFRMAWNEEEDGPAPFACNQRIWIWVSPDGSVDGFELGHSVHRWRHRADGAVELEIADLMVDGGTVLVRVIPDRYSGSEVGKTVYWKGEGLCTGAVGSVPAGRKIHPDDLAAALAGLGAREGKKTDWVSPGTTVCEDEIRLLLRDFAAPLAVAEARAGRGDPFKLRLTSGSSAKKGEERPAPKSGAGWGRSSPPPAARKASGSAVDMGAAFSAFFKKGEKESEEGRKDAGSAKRPPASQPGHAEAARQPEAAQGSVAGSPAAGASLLQAAPGGTATGQVAGKIAETAVPAAAVVAAPPEPEPVRVDERWFDALRDLALHHRRKALDELTRTRSPGSAISQEWVEVRYENQPGEPLRAEASTLPLVPARQLVPELRAMP